MAIAGRLRGIAIEAVVPIVILLAWGVWSARAESFFFPPLTDILRSFRENWLFARVLPDVVPSLGRLVAGYSLAAGFGIVLGVLIGSSRAARSAAGPWVEFLRAIPPPVLVPFAILTFGIGSQFKVFVIAIGCVWPVLLNTIDGVRGIEPVLLETTASYRIGWLDRMRFVLLPAASPRIFAGMRSALSLSLILMVISEMQASTNGIGFFVLQSQRSFAIPDMWSGILLLGLLGYASNAIFVVIERRVLRWHRTAQASAIEQAA
ncbi:MAG: ABC transporter permease [Candidatus Dormibacteraeota bacterium]|nr:ABC transporter permease [Candidatus Dormibacteraeota bacterium]